MFENMYWLYIIFALLGLILCFLIGQIWILRSKISTLSKRYKAFMTGDNGVSVERQLAVEVKELREMIHTSKEMLHQHEILSQMQVQSFQRSGLIKYDAFDDTGDKLSFSLTLLDGANHGFVLSSLVGQETSRIYVKQIVNGQCKEALSSEEAASINMALAGYMIQNQKQTEEDADGEQRSV